MRKISVYLILLLTLFVYKQHYVIAQPLPPSPTVTHVQTFSEAFINENLKIVAHANFLDSNVDSVLIHYRLHSQDDFIIKKMKKSDNKYNINLIFSEPGQLEYFFTAYYWGMKSYNTKYRKVGSYYTIKISPAAPFAEYTQDQTFQLGQNYPNPAKQQISIPVYLAEEAEVHIKIFNKQGNMVRAYDSEMLSPGQNNIIISGLSLKTGTYFYKVTAGKYESTKQMMVYQY